VRAGSRRKARNFAARVERQLGTDILVAAPEASPSSASERDGIHLTGRPTRRAAQDNDRLPRDRHYPSCRRPPPTFTGDDADAAFRDMQKSDAPRSGARRVHSACCCRACSGGCPDRSRQCSPAAPLSRAGDAIVVEREPGDMMRAGKRRVGRLGIAHAHCEGGIVGGALMDQRCPGTDRVLGAPLPRANTS